MFISRKNLNKIVDRMNDLNSRVHDIEHSGVATAINKLNRQVFQDEIKDRESETLYGLIGEYYNTGKPTLKAKVDAIIQHLGIDVGIHHHAAKQATTSLKVTKIKKGRK